MKLHRKFLLLGAAALIIAVIAWLSFPAEPRYQGEPLGRVLDGLYYSPPFEESFSQAEARWISITNVVRSVGSKALPFYLHRLRQKSHSGWYDKLDDWLREKSSERLHLPKHRNPNLQAMLCIQILGPDARSAIPALENMLTDEEMSILATRSLAAIGPAAVPVLTNALVATSSDRVRWNILEALGNLGPAAKPAAPFLLRLVENKGSAVGLSASDLALRALVEIETDSAALKPLLIQCLANTNTAPGAAFGLTRLGPEGFPILLYAVTNTEPKIRAAAEAALQIAQVRTMHPELSFDRFTAIFGQKLMAIAVFSDPAGEYEAMKPILLGLADGDEPTRVAASNALDFLKKKSVEATEAMAIGQTNSATNVTR